MISVESDRPQRAVLFELKALFYIIQRYSPTHGFHRLNVSQVCEKVPCSCALLVTHVEGERE